MRNVLAPTRQARYIPWKRASQRAQPFVAEPVSAISYQAAELSELKLTPGPPGPE